MKEVHQADLAYEQTKSFMRAIQELGTARSTNVGHGGRRTCHDESQVVQYFEGIRELLLSMAEHGYDSRKAPPLGLAVGRDGTLIKEKHGHHRLAAAQVLGLDAIPFAVLTVHTQWLLHRFDVFRTYPDALRDALE